MSSVIVVTAGTFANPWCTCKETLTLFECVLHGWDEYTCTRTLNAFSSLIKICAIGLFSSLLSCPLTYDASIDECKQADAAYDVQLTEGVVSASRILDPDTETMEIDSNADDDETSARYTVVRDVDEAEEGCR